MTKTSRKRQIHLGYPPSPLLAACSAVSAVSALRGRGARGAGKDLSRYLSHPMGRMEVMVKPSSGLPLNQDFHRLLRG